jgi:L-rhamnose mutarotase
MSTFQPLDTFQVHIKLPEIFTRRFAALIPQQRERVNQLMEERTILNYALDMDRSQLWVTMQAKDQEAVMDILATFPIIKEVKVEIFELAFFDTAPMGLPELNMN